jgi:protein involved in polysaccharide export with SLBB domain
VKRILSKTGFPLGMGAVVLAFLCGWVRAQDAQTANCSREGASTSVSADDIISTLRDDPDLLQEVKDVVIEDARERGRPIDADDLTDNDLSNKDLGDNDLTDNDLTDNVLFQKIREDQSVCRLVAREIEKQQAGVSGNSDSEDGDSAPLEERQSESSDLYDRGFDHSRPQNSENGGSSLNTNYTNKSNSEDQFGNYQSRASSANQGRGPAANPSGNHGGNGNREPENPNLQGAYSTRRSPKRPPLTDPNQPATKGMRNPYPGLPSAADLYRQFPAQPARLERFGARLFLNGDRNTNVFPMDLPAGPDYVLGPGDGLFINLWGSVSRRMNVTVDRTGQIALPEAGGVVVAGETLAQAQQMIQRALSVEFKNARSDISLTRLRTVRVYVVGDVAQPGAYDLSSLSTPLNALLAAGGPTANGSLRIVRHYRGTQLVGDVDLYDLMLNGIRSGVERLEPGDTILVPPVGPQIAVAGMVKRPAVYELRNERQLSDVVELAGGVLVSAALRQIKVERIEAHEKRITMSVNLPDGADSDREAFRRALGNFPVQDGDHVTISPILPYSDSTVYLQGHVFRPGKYPYHAGMEIAELLHSYEDLLPEPAAHAEIIRLTPPDYRPRVIQFNLSDVLDKNDSIVLEPFDTIRISGRYEIDAPRVSIHGEVLRPGEYPLSAGMTASDLVRMAGGFRRSAMTHEADITSYVVENGEQVQTRHTTVAISKALAGDADADPALKPDDVVTIHQLAGWKDVGASVVIKGEVMYPGTYGIEEGEKLSSLLQRAGGYRTMAYPEGAVLERVQVRELAEKSKLQLIQEVENSGQNVKFPANASAQDQAALMASISQQQENAVKALRQQPASGRLVINITKDIRKWRNTSNDIELRSGDVLTIPRMPNFVLVTGQVYNPAALAYTPGVSAATYLREGGGPTDMANKKNIYIIRANGSVVGHVGHASLWSGSTLSVALRPGDTIVVPQKVVGGGHAWKDTLDTVELVSSLAIAARVATSF